MLMLIKGGSSFLLYEERWVFDKEFLPRFLSFSLLFSHSFLCYLSGRRNPGLHFLGWIWLSFIRTGYEIVAGVKWLNYPFFPFLFLLLLLLLLFFFFFFFLTYVGEGGILWFACPFHFMKFVHRVIWRNTQRCHMGNGRRLTWCLKLKMIGEIKFDF